jgi:ABC-type uncharacterized transport system ATPase subunit
MEFAIELRGITKVFHEGNLQANKQVSLSLRKGEILCLAGENGAGKTTLMKILCGLTLPTEGEILVKGRRELINSPRVANKLGIGMVHQHFMLFPEFTVAQNVVMGIEPVKWGILYDFQKAKAKVEELIRVHQFSIAADTPVHALTVGQMQQVEILKVLYRKADILILDEPTAVLIESEVVALFRTLKALASAGKSLILITHKLDEIKQVSDRVAVMRRGELISIRETKDIDTHEISRMMLGRNIDFVYHTQKNRKHSRNEPVLSFDQVVVQRQKQKLPLLNKVSFTAYSGEILGFAGASGNGLEVLEAVLGGFLSISSGRIRCGREDISGLNMGRLRRRGLAYIPGDRLHRGSALEASGIENIILGRRKELARWGFLDPKEVSRFSRDRFQQYGITGNERLRIGALSGGNIQKLILAREIDQFRDYILFCEPTWGLDIAASHYIYEQMSRLREKGAAVLLISSNLDEILANADRVLVFYRGAIVTELEDPSSLAHSKEVIGAYMLGLNQKEEHG